MASSWSCTFGLKVVFFKGGSFPFTTTKLRRSLYLASISAVISVNSFLTSRENLAPLATLNDVIFLESKTKNALRSYQISFLHVFDEISIGMASCRCHLFQIQLSLIHNRFNLSLKLAALRS
jgi:hypothetical protein